MLKFYSPARFLAAQDLVRLNIPIQKQPPHSIWLPKVAAVALGIGCLLTNFTASAYFWENNPPCKAGDPVANQPLCVQDDTSDSEEAETQDIGSSAPWFEPSDSQTLSSEPEGVRIELQSEEGEVPEP